MHTAAGNPETLVRCPQHDTEAVCAVAVIMLLTALYQFSLFTVVGMRLFAAPGEIDLVIPVVAAFIAIFIMKIDAYTIMRSGWHLSGIAELKRGDSIFRVARSRASSPLFFLASAFFSRWASRN